MTGRCRLIFPPYIFSSSELRDDGEELLLLTSYDQQNTHLAWYLLVLPIKPATIPIISILQELLTLRRLFFQESQC